MFERYAIYHTFEGGLADRGAAWLGWDIATGTAVRHPDIEGLDLAKVTERPRKYGLHATVKAPFHLAQGSTEEALRRAFASLCASLAPVTLAALELGRIGGFLALTAEAEARALRALAAQTVHSLDAFRAPLSDDALQRRKSPRLSERQRENLMRWGYPHVMDDYRFHVTLTGPLKDPLREKAGTAAKAYFAPVLRQPYSFDSLTLAGQGRDGMFREIQRLSLGA